MDFELQFGKRGGPGRRSPADGTRRILVLGDFAGRGARGQAPAGEPLATRPLVRVPQDGGGVDAALAALRPALELPPSIGGATAALQLTSLEDFHPDALFRRLPIFREPPRAAAAPVAAAPAAAGKSDADDIERLLGKRPASGAKTPGTASSAIDDLIGPLVSKFVSTGPTNAPLDTTALGRIMRAVLHQPAFQALEARWRALELLVSRADEAVEIRVLDLTRAELLADLLPDGADAAGTPALDASALAGHLLAPPGGTRWAAVIGDFAFGPGAEDAALLARLGALAAAAQTPFIGGAAAALVGCASLAGAADPAQWTALEPDDARRWQSLRRGPAASWVGLAVPRFLARAPYGTKTAAIDAFAFEELEGRPAPEALCWATGAFLCALALAHGEEADDAEELDDLPYFTFRGADGDVEMYPSTEVFWGQRAAEAALARGLMPLLSARDRNVVRLVRLQSIADPPGALAAVAAGDAD